jgi:sugar phosphate isomerase/epimerase
MTRRSFAWLAASVAAAGEWEDRLGIMCQLGSSEPTARKVLDSARQAGFRRVMLNFPWDRVTAEFRQALPGWLQSYGLRCEALGAYVNCVSPETVLMSTRESDFADAIGYARELNCRCLVAWTGSHRPELMKADPRNFTRESEDALVRFVERHVTSLERSGVTLALETYVTLTCPDAVSLRRVLDRLPESIGAVLDPPNLTPPGRYAQRDAELKAMVRTLSGRIGVVHLKDFRLTADGVTYALPGPLAGEMNYPLFAEQIKRLPRDVPVAAEHVGPEEYGPVRRKLLQVFDS